MRKHLEVIGKPLSYATRRLQIGDVFTASARDARILTRLGRVRYRRPEAELPAPPAELLAKFDPAGSGEGAESAAAEPADQLKALRGEYFEKLGKRPFTGWDAETLTKKMAEA